MLSLLARIFCALFLSLLFVLPARASFTVEVLALPGSGYSISPNGKIVAITGTSPLNINFAIRGTISGPSNQAQLVETKGTLLTYAGASGSYLTSGQVNSFTINPLYTTAVVAQQGTQQNIASSSGIIIPSDGIGDLGKSGSATTDNGVRVWVNGADATLETIFSGSTSFNAGNATNNVQLATFTLSANSLNASGASTTLLEWFLRAGAGNHSWYENGVAVSSKFIGTDIFGGSAVTVQATPVLTTSQGATVLSFGSLLTNAPLPAATAVQISNSGGSSTSSAASINASGASVGKFNSTNPSVGAIPNGTNVANASIGLTSTSTPGVFSGQVIYTPDLGGSAATVNVSATVGIASYAAGNSSASFGAPLSGALPVNSTIYSGSTALSSSTIAGSAGAGQPPSLGTTAVLLYYANTTGTDTGVAMSWRTRTASEAALSENGTKNAGYLVSDVVRLTGMTNATAGNTATQTDRFVLQMNYNEALLDGFEAVGVLNQKIYLAWNDNGTWVNAVLSNQGAGNTPQFVNRAYQAGDELVLGRWGINTTANTVWAVLNHNSDFAVIPEPSTWLAGGLVLALFGYRQRRQQK
jgi:hypothetical protein